MNSYHPHPQWLEFLRALITIFVASLSEIWSRGWVVSAIFWTVPASALSLTLVIRCEISWVADLGIAEVGFAAVVPEKI